MEDRPKVPGRLTPGIGRANKYPWDVWFDGEPHQIRQGHHFPKHITAPQFRRQVSAKARSLGLVVRTELDGPPLERGDETDNRWLVVQRVASAHDWDSWITDGEPHIMTWGVEFKTDMATMRREIEAQAAARGYTVNVQVKGEQIGFRATKIEVPGGSE